MKKIIALILLPAAFTTSVYSKALNTNVVTDLQKERLTVPQRVCEREHARRKAENCAATTTYCAGFCGGLAGGGLFWLSNNLILKDNMMKCFAAAIAGCAGTVFLFKDKIYKNSFNYYKNDAPMNDALQKLLKDARYKSARLIYVISTVESVRSFVETITIECATESRAILRIHSELLALLSYLERVEKQFKTILREHENLPRKAFVTLETYLPRIEETQQLLKKTIAQIRTTQVFKDQTIEKQKEDLYNAELARIKNAAAAASAQAHASHAQAIKDQAQAQQAQAQASLNNLHWWQDVVNGHNTVHVQHSYR